MSTGKLSAQTCFFAPSNTPTVGTCHTIPWGQRSARYQSLLTAQDLGNKVRNLSKLSFAPCGAGTFTATSITIRFAYFAGTTLSTNFATNLGTSSVVMLNKTNFSFTKYANAWSDVGLTGKFVYIPQLGNLLVDIVFQGGAGGSSFHRDVRQRVYALNWTATPPATGASGRAALKLRVCQASFCANNAKATVYGAGCKSSPQKCSLGFQQNWQQKLANETTTASRIAILESNRPQTNVCRVDLYTMSRSGNPVVTVSMLEYDTRTAKPGKLLSSAKVTVRPTAGMYSVNLPPQLFAQNASFVLAFDNADKLVLPTTSTGIRARYFEFQNNAWGSQKSDKYFQYRIHHETGAIPPVLSSSNTPILGQSFALDLTSAASNRAAVLFIGISNKAWGPVALPFDLTPLGASGCNLLVSPDFLFPLATSATGTLALKLPFPRDSRFCNVHLYFQYLVIDPKVNPLQVILSNGLDAHLGQ